jgi:hypothetical protein
MNDAVTQQSRLKALIAKGKEQGYLTYAEVNDHLPEDISDPDQVEDIIQMINDMGIQVFEQAPDADELLLTEGDSSADDIAAAEAAAALAAVETEAGRTTDPVRMYMREMGTVELLTREGEIVIAKRIEEGIRELMAALAFYPGAVKTILDDYALVAKEERKLADIWSVTSIRRTTCRLRSRSRSSRRPRMPAKPAMTKRPTTARIRSRPRSASLRSSASSTRPKSPLRPRAARTLRPPRKWKSSGSCSSFSS